jgi:outer membrane receptor protein involved in Fe transport
MNSIFGRILTGASLAVLTQSVPAQDEARPASDESRGLLVQEIVVTAQRRGEEQLQDVPISITVLGGDELDSFTKGGVLEALAKAPGFAPYMMDQQFGGSVVSVRGVASGAIRQAGPGPTAFYLDSTPWGFVKSAFAPDMNPYDLDRVEVLRGPQGTLYGAGSLNGVVRILTQDPDLDSFDLKVRASASTVREGGESYRGDVVANLPIKEGKLAVRAVAGYNHVGGWIDRTGAGVEEKDANDQDIHVLRLKVKAQPTDQLTIGLSGWISRTDIGMKNVGCLADAGHGCAGMDTYPGLLAEFDDYQDFDIYGLTVDYEFPGVTLTSQTSYIDFSLHSLFDTTAAFPTQVIPLTTDSADSDSTVFAQEITLQSTSEGPWRWTLGGFYRDAEDMDYQAGSLFGTTINDRTNSSESYAIFGELTRRFLDNKLELTGGLRYFRDDVTGNENVPFNGNTSRPLINVNDKFEHVSPRVVLTWFPSDAATLYASYGQGFRSGFQQIPNILVAAPTIPEVEPDTLTNYEVGAKGYFLDGRLSYDLAVYYMDWKDVQQLFLVSAAGEFPCPAAPCFSAGANGVSASGLGADLAVTARITDRLTVSTAVSYNDLVWDETILAGGVATVTKGTRLGYSTQYTANGSVSYRVPLSAPDLEGMFTASARYTPGLDTRHFGRAVKQTDVSAGFSLSKDRWSALLYVDNVTNDRGSNALQTAGNSFDFISILRRPREIGVQFTYHAR